MSRKLITERWIFPTWLIAGLALATAPGAKATTYSESIADNPSNFTCFTSGDLKTCYGNTVLFPPPPSGTGTLTSGSGVFYANSGDIVNIDINYSSRLYVPIGSGPSIPGERPHDVAFALLYVYDGSQLFAADIPSSSSSVVSGYVGPPGLTLADNNPDAGAFVGFGGPFGNPAAFSITGMDSTITLDGSNPYPVYEVIYGYQISVPEPGSWAIILIGFGGVGAATRIRRRWAAAAVL